MRQADASGRTLYYRRYARACVTVITEGLSASVRRPSGQVPRVSAGRPQAKP